MAIRTLLQLGDPRLREVALPVEDPSSPEVTALITDLADTVAHWRATTGYGRAIAAPQLAEAKRVILLKLPGTAPWPLINPRITWRSEETMVVWDCCLSFLCIFMQVRRHRQITVRYQDPPAPGTTSTPATNATTPSCYSTRSIISMAFSASIVSST